MPTNRCVGEIDKNCGTSSKTKFCNKIMTHSWKKILSKISEMHTDNSLEVFDVYMFLRRCRKKFFLKSFKKHADSQ